MADQRHEWFLSEIFHHRRALQRYVGKLTSRAEDIEDLVQETYLRIYSFPDFHAVESPRALLFRIAHNLVIERARRRKARLTEAVADLEALNVYSLDAPPEEQTDARRRFEVFCAAVEQLPPLCRRVFVLRKVFKLSPEEISEVLGISTSTIEKHVAKGLVRCRDYLREKGLMEVGEGKGATGLVRHFRHQGQGE